MLGFKKNKHMCQCRDCKQHYEVWQKLQEKLHGGLAVEDEMACDEIMAQIRSHAANTGKIRQGGSGPVHLDGKSSSRWSGATPGLWLGAVCSLLLIVAVVFWNIKNDSKGDDIVESVPIPVEPTKEIMKDQDDAPTGQLDPLAMLAALQKEQVLISRDMEKFKTMLNERVIIFRE